MDSVDNSAGEADKAKQSDGKRAKKPSARMLGAAEPSKLPKMVQTDPLLTFVGETIHGDPDAWGVLLTTARGKSSVQRKFINHLSKLPHPLTNGRTSTPESVTNWVKAGLARAQAETERRANSAAAGRGIPTDSVDRLDRVWFDLVQFYNDYLKSKPTTDRYTTPPDHLKGKVQLKYDDSALMPCGREEKATGEKMREEAIAKVAEQRDEDRQEDSKSKRHLHPIGAKRMRAESSSVAPVSNSDAFMQAYISSEADRSKQEIRSAKTAELNSYLAMLASPHLPDESKVNIRKLFNSVTKELEDLSAQSAARGGSGGAAGGSGGAAGGSGSPAFTTPEKSASSSALFSSGDSSGAPSPAIGSRL